MHAENTTLQQGVHCRIGSSEKANRTLVLERFRSLPHRQLRNNGGSNDQDNLVFTAA